MFDREAMMKVVAESYPVSDGGESGFVFGAEDRPFYVRPVGDARWIVYAQVGELDGAPDDQEVAQLAVRILERNDRLQEKGPFSVAVDPGRQFVHIQWVFDAAVGGEEAFRFWLPTFVSCAGEGLNV